MALNDFIHTTTINTTDNPDNSDNPTTMRTHHHHHDPYNGYDRERAESFEALVTFAKHFLLALALCSAVVFGVKVYRNAVDLREIDEEFAAMQEMMKKYETIAKDLALKKKQRQKEEEEAQKRARKVYSFPDIDGDMILEPNLYGPDGLYPPGSYGRPEIEESSASFPKRRRRRGWGY